MRKAMNCDRRVLVVGAIGWMLIAVAANVSYAQRAETDSARADRHAKAEASLAKQSQNPVANMVSLPLQYNYYTAGGLGSASEMVLNVQRAPRRRHARLRQAVVLDRSVLPQRVAAG